jgi:hypothetical protein
MTIDGPAEAVAPLARFATGGSFLNFLHDMRRTESALSGARYTTMCAHRLRHLFDADSSEVRRAAVRSPIVADLA